MNTTLPDYININQIKIINTNKSQSSLINDSLKQTQTLPETDSDFFYISKIELSAKIFNGFKLSNTFPKSPMLDAWRVQNSHLTLIHEKKALSVPEMRDLNRKLVFSFQSQE